MTDSEQPEPTEIASTLTDLGDRLAGFHRLPSIVFVRDELYRLAASLGDKAARPPKATKRKAVKPEGIKRKARGPDDVMTVL